MTDTTRPATGPRAALLHPGRTQRVRHVAALVLAVLAVVDPAQAVDSAGFAGAALLRTAPFLILSIGTAARAGGTGADTPIARAFAGAPLAMVAFGALVGALVGALPLPGGLMAQGMAPGAGLTFPGAGSDTSIPAAMAVWALARPPVFTLHIALSPGGAFLSGSLFKLWAMA